MDAGPGQKEAARLDSGDAFVAAEFLYRRVVLWYEDERHRPPAPQDVSRFSAENSFAVHADMLAVDTSERVVSQIGDVLPAILDNFSRGKRRRVVGE